MTQLKTIFLLLCVAICPMIITAQDYNIDWGEIYPHKESSKTISFSDEHYYVLNKKKKQYEIVQFDYDHNLISTKQLDFKYIDVHQHYWEIVDLKSGRFQILADEDKKNDKVRVLCTSIKSDGQFDSKMKTLASFDFELKTMVAGEDGLNRDKIGVSVSKDSTKVAITSVKFYRDYGKGKGNEIYSIAVFDENMELLWEKDVEFPFADKKIDIQQFEVNNDGEVFLLTKTKQKQPNPDKNINYKFSIYKISPNSDFIELVINPKRVIPLETSFQIIDNQEIIVFGFYTREEKSYRFKPDGLFSYSFSSKGERLFQNTSDFKNDYYAKLNGEDGLAGENSLRYFNPKIDEILYNREKGNYLLIAESRYLANIDNYQVIGIKEDDIYFYTNQIIVLLISDNGAIKWATPIIKDFGRKKNSINFTSYVVTFKNGNLYFIFNDEKTVKEQKSYDKKRKSMPVITEIVKIDGDGEIKFRDVLFLPNERLRAFNSKYSKNIEDGKILICNAKYYKYKYGVLTLE
jgi:hypothetical protein